MIAPRYVVAVDNGDETSDSKVSLVLSWTCERCRAANMMLVNEGNEEVVEPPACMKCGAPGPTRDVFGQPIPIGRST